MVLKVEQEVVAGFVEVVLGFVVLVDVISVDVVLVDAVLLDVEDVVDAVDVADVVEVDAEEFTTTFEAGSRVVVPA
jgi:hypothetical protein